MDVTFIPQNPHAVRSIVHYFLRRVVNYPVPHSSFLLLPFLAGGTGESDRDDELALKEEHLVLNSSGGGAQPPSASSSGAGAQPPASSSSGIGSVFLPAAGLTQRATLDPDLDEIHVLSGCFFFSAGSIVH